MMNHRFCLHATDRVGRASCRAAGGPYFYHWKLQEQILKAASCEACFRLAVQLGDRILDYQEVHPDTPHYILEVMTWQWADRYLRAVDVPKPCSHHRVRQSA